jgi:ubiquinone/menaquinone biosynthesis C-methylase UbiE
MDDGAVKSEIAGVFDRSAATYEQVGPEFFAPMGRELARRAAPRAGERVLDVGCGRGHCLLPAAEAVGPDGAAVGVDLAPGMVAATAADARRRGLAQVTVRVGDAAAPEVEPGSCDVVTAGLVIFFLPDPEAALRAWARALRPGGRLALTTFTAMDPAYGAAMKAVSGFVPQVESAPTRPAAERFRTGESVTEALATTGFTAVRHEDVTFQTRFADLDEWWNWIWSHGGRDMLEKIPEDALDAARSAGNAAMEAARTPEDDLAIHTTVRYTTARLA